MSEPIIIETPAPPTRERLVCIREQDTSRSIDLTGLRDATPADLARGGWVAGGEHGNAERAALLEQNTEMLCLLADVFKAAGGLTGEVPPGFTPGGVTLTAVRDLRARAEKTEAHAAELALEREEAIVRAEKAEGLLVQRETELRLAREDGAAVERRMREARSAADASFVRANKAEMRAEKAERERDEERLNTARERDEARRAGAEVLTLRAELAGDRLEAADQRETRARNALRAAGIPDVEPYPAEAVDAREASLRTGGRALRTAERIERLARERDEAKEFARVLTVELDTLRKRDREAREAVVSVVEAVAKLVAQHEALRAELTRVERERDEAAARADEAESMRDEAQRSEGDLRAELATERARADANDEKAKAFERDWHAAKTEFGVATSKLREQLREAAALLATAELAVVTACERAEQAEGELCHEASKAEYAYALLKAYDNYGSEDLSVCVREVLRVIIDKDQWIDKTERELAVARGETARLAEELVRRDRGERTDDRVADRATDQELFVAYDAAYLVAGELTHRGADAVAVMPEERAGILAVAARVRQERCLVAQAVAANVDIRVAEDDRGGFMVGAHACGRDEELERAVLSSDVPATLARLLGEVSRG